MTQEDKEFYNNFLASSLGDKIEGLENIPKNWEDQLKAELDRYWEICADSRKGFKYTIGSNYQLFMDRDGIRFPPDPSRQEDFEEDFIDGSSEITEVQPMDSYIVNQGSTVDGIKAVVITLLGNGVFLAQEEHEEVVAATMQYESELWKVLRPFEEIEKALDVAVELDIITRIVN